MTHYDYREFRPVLSRRTGKATFLTNAVSINRSRNIFNQVIEKQLKELNMTIEKNRIEIGDIQVGDTIRAEWDDTKYTNIKAKEYIVKQRGDVHSGATRSYLLDRPKKIKWAKGTTLWLTEDLYPWAKNERITLAADCLEGDRRGSVLGKPHNICGRYNVTLTAVTDIKPEPHPVGATRWITEDHFSAHGVRILKGFKVTVAGHERTGDYDLSIKWPDQYAVFSKSKFLSATPVEPAPVFVSVRKDALDALRGSVDWSGRVGNINEFLKTVDE